MAKDNVSSPRHGVVGVVYEANRFLVIRRSMKVRAPGLLCFPGGHIEAGESFEQAIIREMMEELSMSIRVRKHLWSSVTHWGTKLEWMHIERLALDTAPVPFLDEVSEVHWMQESELLGGLDVLGSVPDFFEALHREVFSLGFD
ncbi:MAG: NUDIX domain-containing protein [Pirellulaceae bacterium]|nr:NUDIX domain-containing protein [Pirellulaceae bacterium]